MQHKEVRVWWAVKVFWEALGRVSVSSNVEVRQQFLNSINAQL